MSRATAHLTLVDPVLGAFIARAEPLRRPPSEFTAPYHALLSAVAHQQLHARAAIAILGRLRVHFGGELPQPAALLALPVEALRACGFSAAKIIALRDVAEKTAAGVVPSAAAASRLNDENLITRLTQIRGIGRWSVEMLLIFTLRRANVLPVDDFGVREGYRLLHGLAAQPKPKALALLGQAYAPHRTLAALYFWQAADLAK